MCNFISGLGVSALVFTLGFSSLFSQEQVVTPDPVAQRTGDGADVSFGVFYTTSNPQDETLTGLGLRMHFDSSRLTFVNLTSLLMDGFVAQGLPTTDNLDFDGDPATDSLVLISWADITGDWPGEGTEPAQLFVANFTAASPFSAVTSVNFSASSTAAGRSLASTSATISPLNGQFGQRIQYFPQFAIGGPAETQVTVHNPGGAPILVAVELRRSDGSVFLEDEVELAPNATETRVYKDPQTPVEDGWAKLTSEDRFAATLYFQIPGTGNVGVLPSSTAEQLKLLTFVATGTNTGLAVANPSEDACDMTFFIYDEAGRRLSEAQKTLGPLEHDAFLVTEDPLAVRASGSILIEASSSVVALALRLDEGLLASIPVLTPQELP